MNAATWTVTVSLTEADAEVSARAVLRAGGKVFEGSGTAGVNPHDVVSPAPGAAQAAERALLDLVESIRCARLQRFAVGGFGPLMLNRRPDGSTPDNGRHNGFGAGHNGFHAIPNGATPNGATRDHDGMLAQLSGG